MPECPNCGADAGFRSVSGAGCCSDTGSFDGDFLECLECGAPTDVQELERIARAERIEPKRAVPVHCICGSFAFMGTANDAQPQSCDWCQKREWRARA